MLPYKRVQPLRMRSTKFEIMSKKHSAANCVKLTTGLCILATESFFSTVET